MQTEHTPSNAFPGPQETDEAFAERMKKEGVPPRPQNVADF